MSRPKGSLNKSTIAAQSATVTTDGYAQSFTGAGGSRDRSSYTRIKSVALMQENELASLYIGDGFARAIVDIPAEEMTRAGIGIEDMDDDELEDSIEARLEELDAMRHMNDGLRWSRLMGGSLLIYGLNDGGQLDVPLNPQGIKAVEFLRVYDRWEAVIQKRYDDPMMETYGKPELWLISPRDGGTPYLVHDSRVHQFDGDSIPNLQRQANQGWGASTLQSCKDQLERLGMSHLWANALMERAQQAIHGIPRLTNLLSSKGGEEMVMKRVDVVDMVRGILNTIVIDSEESYDLKSTSFAGVPDLMDRFAEALSAVSRIPVSVLMGRAQGGLSNTDKGQMDTWYARIESMQNDILRKPLDRLVNYIFISLTGQDGGDYKLCFKPLVVQSDKEEAEVEKLEAETKKIKMETAVGYVGIAALDSNEVRVGLKEEYQITGTIEIPPADALAAQQNGV